MHLSGAVCNREVCSIPQCQDDTSQADALAYFSTFLNFTPFPSVWSGNKPMVQMLLLALLSPASQVVLTPWVVASLQEPLVSSFQQGWVLQAPGAWEHHQGRWLMDQPVTIAAPRHMDAPQHPAGHP